MFPGWIIVASAIGYLLFLFAVASYGDRKTRVHGVPAGGRPVVYALSLAVYCTSWTYFGGVGLAAEHGLEFMAIYIGPILMYTLGMPILRRIVELAKTDGIASAEVAGLITVQIDTGSGSLDDAVIAELRRYALEVMQQLVESNFFTDDPGEAHRPTGPGDVPDEALSGRRDKTKKYLRKQQDSMHVKLELSLEQNQALLRADARTQEAAQALLNLAAQAGEQLPGREHLTLYPAVPMAIQRVANVERAQMLIESDSRPALQAFLAAWQEQLQLARSQPEAKGVLRWAIDVDPLAI